MVYRVFKLQNIALIAFMASCFLSCMLGLNIVYGGSIFSFSVKSTIVTLVFCLTLLILITIGFWRIKNSTVKQEGCESLRHPGAAECSFLASIFSSTIRIALVLLICWLPYYLVTFPGLFVYDAATQIHDAIDLRLVSAFHPLIHTYWMSACIEFGMNLFNSDIAGFAMYIFSQMAGMSLAFGCCIRVVSKLSNSPLVPLFSALFIALFPVFPILAVSATKDSMFSALFALMCAIWAESLGASRPISFKRYLILLLVSLLVSLFRNNASYLILLLCFIFVLFRQIRKSIAPLKLIVLGICCFAVSSIFPKLVAQKNSGPSEMLGVPIQQACAALNDDEAIMSLDDRRALEEYLPSWEKYNPYITDPVKFTFPIDEKIKNDSLGFLRAWAKVGINNFGIYLDSFLKLTLNYWSPLSGYSSQDITKPYLEYDQWEYLDSSSLGRNLGPAGYDVYRHSEGEKWTIIPRASLIPQFEPIVRKLCYDPIWKNSVLLYGLTSPALLFLVSLISGAISLYYRNRVNALFALLPVSYYLTCFLGPCYLVRYAFPLYSCFPFIVLLSWDALQFLARLARGRS